MYKLRTKYRNITSNEFLLVNDKIPERFGRQEREKLAKMEAQMAEHERKLKEEQEKLDKLDQIHKVLQFTE